MDWILMAREGWGRKDLQEGRFFILLRCGKKMLEHIPVLLVMALEQCQRTKSSLTYFVSIQWEFSIEYLYFLFFKFGLFMAQKQWVDCSFFRPSRGLSCRACCIFRTSWQGWLDMYSQSRAQSKREYI